MLQKDSGLSRKRRDVGQHILSSSYPAASTERGPGMKQGIRNRQVPFEWRTRPPHWTIWAKVIVTLSAEAGYNQNDQQERTSGKGTASRRQPTRLGRVTLQRNILWQGEVCMWHREKQMAEYKPIDGEIPPLKRILYARKKEPRVYPPPHVTSLRIARPLVISFWVFRYFCMERVWL